MRKTGNIAQRRVTLLRLKGSAIERKHVLCVNCIQTLYSLSSISLWAV